LSFHDALKLRLKVMDATAFALCQDNGMPILVFNMNSPDSIQQAVMGKPIGTLVH
jgi:uridylate kinase